MWLVLFAVIFLDIVTDYHVRNMQSGFCGANDPDLCVSVGPDDEMDGCSGPWRLYASSFASCLSLPCIVWVVYSLPPWVRVWRRYLVLSLLNLLFFLLPVISCLDTCQQALGDDFGSAYIDKILTQQCCWLYLFCLFPNWNTHRHMPFTFWIASCSQQRHFCLQLQNYAPYDSVFWNVYGELAL